MEPLLRAEHVTVCYNGKPAVQDVSFSLEAGKTLGIVGESGSGKSTLLRAMAGLLGSGGAVTEGDIWFDGKNLTDLPKRELRRLLGPGIGMVFQDSQSALCPVRTIGDQIYESFSEHEKISRREAYARAGALMQKIGLKDEKRILKSYPFELSGGMNQRVGLCIAMMMHPALLLADEPTSALDVTVQAQVLEEMGRLREAYGTAMVLVTHNIGVAEALADQVLVLRQGKRMEYGPAGEVLCHPQNAYTRELLSSVLHLRKTPG